ncbi:MAG: glycosyltransferase family 39 protein, partial [Myxococcales bacterium]|nr:glycosyltransferase family 39 protein [Myxococcales bacterium]
MASPPETKRDPEPDARSDARRATTIDARIDALSKALLVALAIIAVLTFDDFGLTWDEGYHIRYGDHLLDYYTSGFEDRTALTYRLDYLYGGGFDLLGAIFRAVARPMDNYTALHLFGSLIGVLGIAGAWRLGRAIGGARVGLYALVMLALTHVYYGHMFNNPKDLPFAVGYVWGLYFVCEAIRAFPRLGWRLVAWLALALGMAMSVRIAGLLLICYLVGVIGLWALRQGIARRSFEALYRHASGLYLRAGAAIVGAWAVMLIFWPWAQQKPLTRPFVALTRMSKFLTHRRKMPFDGEWIDTLDTPPDYLLHYFGYKMPELILALFVAGMLGGLVWILARGWRLENTKRALIYGTLGLAVLLPPAYAVYKESVLYDGLRHFLFLIPPMVVIAALTLGASERWLRRRLPRAGGAIVGVVLALFVADHLRIAVVYHPHHYVWFNRILGGLAEADGVYSTDYYGETFREALEELERELRRREPERFADTTYRVSGCLG